MLPPLSLFEKSDPKTFTRGKKCIHNPLQVPFIRILYTPTCRDRRPLSRAVNKRKIHFVRSKFRMCRRAGACSRRRAQGIVFFHNVRTKEPPSEREGDHAVVEGACANRVLMISSALFIVASFSRAPSVSHTLDSSLPEGASYTRRSVRTRTDSAVLRGLR